MTTAQCRVADCTGLAHARGLCPGHYQRWRKGVPVETPLVRKSLETCTADGCDRPTRTRKLCKKHYERIRTGLPLDLDARLYQADRLCSVQECDRRYYGSGFCSLHYDRQRRGIPFEQPIRDGRIAARNGYVYLRIRSHPGANSGGYIFEHRAVMEQVLGRPLLPSETVHHINGVRDDNRPENLELWVTSQPSGQRPADLVAWAREILARYDEAPGA